MDQRKDASTGPDERDEVPPASNAEPEAGRPSEFSERLLAAAKRLATDPEELARIEARIF